MDLIDKSGSSIDNPWLYPTDTNELEHSPVSVIRLVQWNDYCTRFKSYPAGVWVTTDLDASQLERVLDHVELVVVEFPRSRDGRGFTLARLLRERHHYQGDIRAAGPLLPDQFSVLLECGYTSLLASSSVPLVRWRDAADSLSQARAKPRTLLDRLSRHRHS